MKPFRKFIILLIVRKLELALVNIDRWYRDLSCLQRFDGRRETIDELELRNYDLI